jgi:hypothetical protein
MHRVSSGLSASPAENPASAGRPAGLEPMWPALKRGLAVLLSLATPFVVTLLSR